MRKPTLRSPSSASSPSTSSMRARELAWRSSAKESPSSHHRQEELTQLERHNQGMRRLVTAVQELSLAREMFDLVEALQLASTTRDERVLRVLAVVVDQRRRRQDFVPDHVDGRESR